uniref:Carnitine O-palmitoyltransferase 2, mitochondrial n=1 Tax=Aceria tosichella TaxID=561515 RepID=A0A6G1S4I7_9ACAR
MSRLTGQAYQYLQKSKIPTNKFQRSLPRLKIPKLDRTCQRYIAALEPIFAHDSRYQRAIEVANQFQTGPGPDLHKALVSYDKTVKHTSYINDFWFNMYLSSRVPLPLNFNPFMVWRDAPTSDLNHQLVRSTNFLVSACRFKRSLEENVLEPEVFHLNPKKVPESYGKVMTLVPESIATYVSFMFKAFPLDMSQYKNLFNSTRIPHQVKDEIVKSNPRDNRHVLVLKDGQFYTFDLLNEDGSLKTPEDIYSNLSHIASQPKPAENYLSISELTTANRDFWAGEREHLVNLSERNKQNLAKLDSAMFALCLDDVVYEDPKQKIVAAQNFLHGSNPKGPLNRWFDKSFSLIITRDGHAAINFEHSWGDGVAILRFFNDTYYDSTNQPQLLKPLKETDKNVVNVDRLDFKLDARLRESIAKSRNDHLKTTSNLELGAVEYEKLNRDYFKKNKLSPDAMSQLSFQVAFKKIYGATPVTYESCSTAAFRGGRTETVRPCTNETNAAAQAIIENRNNSKMSNGDLKSLLQKSSQKHYQLCKEASMGDGFDRHLFALKEMASRSGKQLPELFSDPIFLQSQHYTLSTSTLYGECFAGGGFAPVVPDGFGLGYGYVDSNFGVLVSSYKSHRNNTQFVQALNESLDDLRKIVET